MEQDQYTYPCVTNSCNNLIRFTPEDEQRFIDRKFVDKFGRVTKPKYCRSCKLKRQQQGGQR